MKKKIVLDELGFVVPTAEERTLLRRVRRRTHLCGCFPLYISRARERHPHINVAELEKVLTQPRDRAKFVKYRGRWYHASCAAWHRKLVKEIQAERRAGKIA